MAITLEQMKTLTPEQQQRVATLAKVGTDGKTQALKLAEDLYNLNSTPAKTNTPATPTTVAPVPGAFTPVAATPTQVKPVVADVIKTTPTVATTATPTAPIMSATPKVTATVAPKITPTVTTPVSTVAKTTTITAPVVPKTTTPAPTTTATAEQFTIPGTQLSLPKTRAVEIAKNLTEGQKNVPANFTTREIYNAKYGYATKPAAEQALLDTYWNEKVQPTISVNVAEKGNTAYGNLQSPELLNSTPEALAKEKQSQIVAQYDKDFAKAQDKLTKGLSVISENSAALQTLYGIKADGSIDTANENGLANKLTGQLQNFKDEKNKLLLSSEGAQLNAAQGNMRSVLASRGYTTSNVPPEVLIGLSGQLGVEVLTNIAKLRNDTVNSILAEEKSTNAQIMQLQEKWVIDANQARTASETLRSQVEDLKSNIDKQVKSDILGVATTEVERKQTQADNVLNAVTKFGAQLGLSGTGMQAISNYLSAFKNPKDAIAGMLADLKNPNSSLYKEVGKVEAMRIAAASAELALKKLTAEAALTRAGAAQTTAEAKALAAANTEAKPVTLTAQQAALSASLGLGSNDDKFVKDNFTTLLNAVLYQKPVQLPSGKVLQWTELKNALDLYNKASIWALQGTPESNTNQGPTTSNPYTGAIQ